MALPEFYDVERFVPRDRRLDVYELPAICFSGINDRAERVVQAAYTGIAQGLERIQVQVDHYPEVIPAFANRASNTFQLEVFVLFGITQDDVTAPSPDQLIKPHVFEVSAIAQHDKILRRAGIRCQFFN